MTEMTGRLVNREGFEFWDNTNHALPVNAAQIEMLDCVRRAIVWLSVVDIIVVRVQIKGGRSIIETATAIPGTFPQRQIGDKTYRVADFYGCQIIWRGDANE